MALFLFCLSVCLPQAGIVSKRLNLRSRRNSSFLGPNISVKPRRRPSISLYLRKLRDKFTYHGRLKGTRMALSNTAISSDLEWCIPLPNNTIFHMLYRLSYLRSGRRETSDLVGRFIVASPCPGMTNQPLKERVWCVWSKTFQIRCAERYWKIVVHTRYSMWYGSRDLCKFCKLTDNLSKMVQDKDIAAIED